MIKETRTGKSIKNAQVSLICYFAQLILGFFARKAFFDYLGSEILGLNTTATNLLGLLNLAELGVSASVGFFLYQPLYEKDYAKLNKLVSIQGWIYRRVAFFIIGASLVMMMFFNVIFSKSPLPLWYAYCTFGVLLFSSMLGYFYNYRQIVLYADQKNYKIQIYVQGSTIIKTVLQIIAISCLPYPFFSWMILEVIGAVSVTLLLNMVLKREYPWLETKTNKGREYMKEYPEVLKKTGQAFFHCIGTVLMTQSSPLIIYGFTTLTTVALYGNYVMIVSKISMLLSTVYGSTSAAVGNLIASKDKNRIIKVFWELYDSRMAISLIALLCLFYLTNPLITVWLGKEYCFDRTFLLLFILMNSVTMTRTTVDSYINAYGLFKDIWAPLIETGLSIGLSILLGIYYGLNGIIIGMTLSQIIIILMWKPYFLFRYGLRISPRKYFIPYAKRTILSIGIFIITFYLFETIIPDSVTTVKDLIVRTAVVFSVCTVMVYGIFFALFKGVREFTFRIKDIIFRKTNS